MGLTGSATLVVAILLMLCATAGTLVLWRPIEATGVFRWPLRAAMVLGSQLTAVLVAGLALNHAYDFYGSWSELFGSAAHSDSTVVARGSIDPVLAPELAIGFHAGTGTMTTLRIPGNRSGVPAMDGLLYLPAAYGDPANARRQFPVVELLTGYPGTPHTWVSALDIKQILDSEIAAGRSAPFIAVIPDQNPRALRDTECVNAVNGLHMDTYLTYDVRDATEQAVRASHDGSQWTAMGYSTGGYCATNLSFQHPGLFGAAVSIAGYDRAALDSTTGNLFGRDTQARLDNNVVWRAEHLPMPRVNLLLVGARQDPAPVLQNIDLERAVREPAQVYAITLPWGGHNMATFKAEIPTCLAWLSRYVSGPLATAPTVDGLSPVLTTPNGLPRAPLFRHPPGTDRLLQAAPNHSPRPRGAASGRAGWPSPTSTGGSSPSPSSSSPPISRPTATGHPYSHLS